jgi:hypothetical protein
VRARPTRTSIHSRTMVLSLRTRASFIPLATDHAFEAREEIAHLSAGVALEQRAKSLPLAVAAQIPRSVHGLSSSSSVAFPALA